MPLSSLRLPARRSYRLAASLVMVSALALSATAGALAADDLSPAPAGSLDSMWSDQPSDTPASSTPATPAIPAPAGSTPVTSTLPATAASGTSAPMCSVESFKQSSLVSKGAWPGIGPFKGSGMELQDDAGNRLVIKAAEDRITEAQVSLTKDKPVAADFLDIQMTADFLLEAVGASGKKISEFNSQIEKNKDAILFKAERPLEVPVGRYFASIQRDASGERVNYIIRVSSQEASLDALKEHSTTAVEAPTPGPATSVTDTTAAASPDDMKETLGDVIRTWQKIKKIAVRQRQTTELSEVLSGRALAKQTEAVKWLANNHKYYEMNPKGVIVDKLAELTPGRKFAVYAQVREASKYIDEATGQTLKETDDTYKVNYTLERLGDRWFITDSAIVAATTAPQAVRPQGNKASR